MRRFTIHAIAALMFALFLTPALASARDAFIGTWKVIVTPDDDAKGNGQKEIKDTFVFKGDQFESAAWKAHGFKSSQYQEDTRAGIVATFKCKIDNDKDKSTAEWTGTSTGRDISGELTWTTANGTVYKYTFKGEKQ